MAQPAVLGERLRTSCSFYGCKLSVLACSSHIKLRPSLLQLLPHIRTAWHVDPELAFQVRARGNQMSAALESELKSLVHHDLRRALMATECAGLLVRGGSAQDSLRVSILFEVCSLLDQYNPVSCLRKTHATCIGNQAVPTSIRLQQSLLAIRSTSIRGASNCPNFLLRASNCTRTQDGP